MSEEIEPVICTEEELLGFIVDRYCEQVKEIAAFAPRLAAAAREILALRERVAELEEAAVDVLRIRQLARDIRETATRLGRATPSAWRDIERDAAEILSIARFTTCRRGTATTRGGP
jgi:hypothetical protein